MCSTIHWAHWAQRNPSATLLTLSPWVSNTICRVSKPLTMGTTFLLGSRIAHREHLFSPPFDLNRTKQKHKNVQIILLHNCYF
ncbi:Uncharacterized protein APZ42_004810 [Daphnia magna]|uniref:Uncharacterized protein n=1 Tax=Daphnia magna TaxID=35525 RepID=A0A162CUH8_9CRUS|nr:Uncharacterized protein APZ42_004810 [Daphnia magna]